MMPAPSVLQPDRSARNRLKTVLVMVLFLALLAPFVLAVDFLASAAVVHIGGRQTLMLARQVQTDQTILNRSSGQVRTESWGWVENDLAEKRAALERSRAADRALLWKLMPVVGAALAGLLGLLIWAVCSSPVARLLAETGAVPAGAAESEAARLLERLSAAAGLDTPKLYIVAANTPTLLVCGTDSRNAVVAVTRGALALLDSSELEALLAHHVSHIVNQDIRLNTALASVSLVMRMPHRLLRGQLSGSVSSPFALRRKLYWLALALTPIGLYLFFAAPLLGLFIRALASRDREYMADADAAALTDHPEALLRALARLAGANAALRASTHPLLAHSCCANPGGFASWLRGSFAAQPPLAERMERVAESHHILDIAGVREAVEAGKEYARQHPAMNEEGSLLSPELDGVTPLNQGNVMGRVCRVRSTRDIPVYDNDRPGAIVAARLQPGSLVVVFDAAGGMRQVNTPEEVFGYIDRKVKLEPIDGVLPQEVYDPKLRASAEGFLERGAPSSAEPARGKLSHSQVWIVAAFGITVFTAMTLVLILFAGK